MPPQPPPRVVVERVSPEIDGGRFPIKRVVDESVVVDADIFADGHDVILAFLLYRHIDDAQWHRIPLQELGNDQWRAAFTPDRMGRYEYTVEAWIDTVGTWHRDLIKRVEAGQDVSGEWLEGARLLREAAARTGGQEAERLAAQAQALVDASNSNQGQAPVSADIVALAGRLPDPAEVARYGKALGVWVDRLRARYGAWYEFFPRSFGPEGRHGTLRDAAAQLTRIAALGFDVVYLPPIHPIGTAYRKGPNNSLEVSPNDPGSPWAIGSPEGGHTAIHPQLGTLDDFAYFVSAAKELGMEVALDIAYQCSPDHPWVREHPDWFRQRADGTIRYAENPPKKYQDIYPLNFECEDWRGLWNALRDVVLFWINHGVNIFRVDNPHTKPFSFWEWMIGSVQERHPQAIFLSEAFTRPKIMRRLAKCGFTQSYTYFTWRNTKQELTEYLTELSQTAVAEYLRGNLFANTPDILHDYLQRGGVAGFQIRHVLAATLGASYGIYGPPFELCEGRAHQASEEYVDSEKYQLRRWDFSVPNNISDYIAKINRIRRENPALWQDRRLRFYLVDDDRLLFYGKTTPNLDNIILVVVNLDPRERASGWAHVPVDELGLDRTEPYEVQDLLSDTQYLWRGERNFVQLDPAVCPAHIFRLYRRY